MIFVDFHHNSLLRSLVLLFEQRLDISVYRPIGMDWYYQGYWAINDLEPTARQFLDINTTEVADKTPFLNDVAVAGDGIYCIYDPGNKSIHKAIEFNTFKEIKFDFIIASIPQHIPLFQDLIKKYQPQAKLIVQIGNNWNPEILKGHNVMASVKPMQNTDFNAVYYHQEFDTNIFTYKENIQNKKISSYINILQHTKGWDDFSNLESFLSPYGYELKSYGGQCRDGNFAGPHKLAESMHDNDLIFHVKYGGDGYGHVIYNTYACGRAPIIRSSFYRNQLAEELFADDNCIDLDKMSMDDAVNKIKEITGNQELLNQYSMNAFNSFQRSVNFENDAEKVFEWLHTI